MISLSNMGSLENLWGVLEVKKLEFLSLVPSQTPHPDKDKILVFMKQSPVAAIAPGIPTDRLTGEHIPCGLIAYEAFDYCWTSMDAWNFENYNFPLPDDFIEIASKHYLDHIRNRLMERKTKLGGTDPIASTVD